MRDYIDILRDKNYLLLWLGQGVSNIGSRVSMIALSLMVLNLTGRAAAVSLLFIVLTIPSIVIGPWAGALVDRWNKKQVIIICDIIMGILALGMAFVQDLSYIYVLALLMSAVNMFFSPAIRTVIPRLVAREKLQTANALYSVTFYTAQLAGPALGGAMVGIFGIQSAFILNGVSFLISALSEVFIQIPPSEAEGSTGTRQMLRDFKEGFAYIRHNPVVRFVIVYFALTSLPAVGVGIASLVVLREVFGFSEAQYGLLMTINGAGLLLGTLVVGQLKKVSELSQMVLGSAIYGVLCTVLALSGWFWAVAALQLGIGLVITLINVSYGTYLQKAVPGDKQGRVFALDIAIGNVTGLLAMAGAGFLADTLGAVTVMAGAGIVLAAISVLAANLSPYREGIRQLKEAV